jgi:hypothetical protein
MIMGIHKNMLRRFCRMLVVATLPLVVLSSERARGQDPSPAGSALRSVFSPQRTPARKTMGLLQRSFLDLVEQSQAKLEVALVIDGTESMAADIEGVRQALQSMVEDLRRYRGDQVSFAVVVYRDLGAPSREVTIPLKQFTNDQQVLQQAFSGITSETGAPYFYEAADLGIHRAMTELGWSDDESTTRWLIVFGDAPPYDADFVDKTQQTGARRYYDTDLLIQEAKTRGIQINCILCTSRPEEEMVYKQVLDKTRGFMNSLSSNTNGLMLDLSYPDIRKALIDSAKLPEMEYEPIAEITQDDIRLFLASNNEPVVLPVGTNQRVRIAVLPHIMPLEEMNFDPQHKAVQVATELRLKLSHFPNTEVVSPVDIRREMRKLRASTQDVNAWLQELAMRLRVDYIVWGDTKEAQQIVRVKSAVFTKVDGRQLIEADVTTSARIPELQLAGSIIQQLAKSGRNANDPVLAANFARFPDSANDNLPANNQPNLVNAVLTPVADTPQQRSDLLMGLEYLEQSLQSALGSEESQELLGKAEQHLTTFAAERNALANMLLASCYYNQAQYHALAGRPDAAKELVDKYIQALRRAYRDRDQLKHESLQREIEGDYALLVNNDYAAAVQQYQKLTQDQQNGRLKSALRGHWMLAGIYSGDWGVPETFRNPQLAREHLVQILAQWGDSEEARFIKTSLRWDEEKGKTEFKHLPRRNNVILASR